MAKKIIILDKTEKNGRQYRVLFWLTVPVGRETFYVRPSGVDAVGNPVPFTSEWKGASQTENEAIAAGSVHEIVEQYTLPASVNLAQVQAFLEARYAEHQQEVDDYNPWSWYGSFWDGVDWTTGGYS